MTKYKLRILLTGQNRRIAVNVSDHLAQDKGYKTTLCAANEGTLMRKAMVVSPHVVIICLGNEDSKSCREYDALLDVKNKDWISTIIVADKEDYKLFKECTSLKHLYFLSRPVSLEALYDKLEEVETRLEKDRNWEETAEPDNDEEGDGKKKRILVVDDDTEQLHQIKENLTEFYDVRAVRSGAAALKFLEKHRIDLILLDDVMPEMHGPDVLNHIRESGDYPWIPVIFLTGIAEKQMVIKTLVELKPQGYIVKPAKKSELVSKIIDVIG